jgi:hypothetical protein
MGVLGIRSEAMGFLFFGSVFSYFSLCTLGQTLYGSKGLQLPWKQHAVGFNDGHRRVGPVHDIEPYAILARRSKQSLITKIV